MHHASPSPALSPLALRSCPRRRGFSLVEVVVATAISSVAMIALASVVVLCTRFLKEGFWENRLRSQAAGFVEECKQALTFAYRNDAIIQANRPTINAGKNSVAFTTPDDGGAPGLVDRYVLGRTGSGGTGDRVELIKNGSVIASLGNVADFNVENHEGVLAFVLTVDYSFVAGNRETRKQFTITGRALPRNMGQMSF
ncbi:MAG TPA: prepilin-type N-terminal cleavage/methylation domain-containing protein [Sumerlaeia bacterium]|nr:prepilin-type N-terminal cleavage/methylation domain-containing protein [Sumerlaeia bacterium]